MATHTSQTSSGRSPDDQLKPVMTITPELYEKLYLGPKPEVKGNLRKIVANPTPLGLIGFVVGLTPTAAQLMGWRGSGGGAIATTADSIWFGGVLLLIAGIMEFILGNNLPFLVFMGYGMHFFTYATTFIPWFNAVAAYSPDGSQTQTPEFNAGFGFYTVMMTGLSFIYLIASLRSNAIFVVIFIFATLGFGIASGAEWQLAQQNMQFGVTLLKGAGGCFFGACMLGWYMLLAQILAIMEIPGPSLPIFDLSTHIRARRSPQADEAV